MRVKVHSDRCQGHTLCNMHAPDVFELREEDGHSVVRVEQVPAQHHEAVRRAAEGCPEHAIEIIEP